MSSSRTGRSECMDSWTSLRFCEKHWYLCGICWGKCITFSCLLLVVLFLLLLLSFHFSTSIIFIFDLKRKQMWNNHPEKLYALSMTTRMPFLARYNYIASLKTNPIPPIITIRHFLLFVHPLNLHLSLHYYAHLYF